MDAGSDDIADGQPPRKKGRKARPSYSCEGVPPHSIGHKAVTSGYLMRACRMPQTQDEMRPARLVGSSGTDLLQPLEECFQCHARIVFADAESIDAMQPQTIN